MNKFSASCCKSGGIRKNPFASSIAKIGEPAVTVPNIGIAVAVAPIAFSPICVNSIALGLLGSRWIYPFFSKRERCPCTVEVEESPTALQISRTVGG